MTITDKKKTRETRERTLRKSGGGQWKKRQREGYEFRGLEERGYSGG